MCVYNQDTGKRWIWGLNRSRICTKRLFFKCGYGRKNMMWSTSRVAGTVWQKLWIPHMPQLGLAIPSVWSVCFSITMPFGSKNTVGSTFLLELNCLAVGACSLLFSTHALFTVLKGAKYCSYIWPQQPVWDALGSKPSYSLFEHAQLNMLPCRSLLGHQNVGDPSRANFVVAKPITQYAQCTPRWNAQGAGYFTPSKYKHLIDDGLHMSSKLFIALS